jgi:valyl-tRNA synthetase
MAKTDAESFLKIVHPFCPHLTEELWGKIGNKPFISLAEWPKFNEKKIDKKFEQEEELISKTQRDIVHVKGLLKLEKPKVYIYCIPPEVKIFEEQQEFLTSVTGSKFVKVFASNAKDIVDPEKKAKKAKPGRPSIYLE